MNIIWWIIIYVWTPQQSGTTYDLERVFFIDSLHGWVVGTFLPPLQGIILRTQNGGNTWNIIYQSDSFSLYGIWFNDLNEGWAVGGTGSPGYYIPQRILHTADGGNTWQIQYNNNPNTSWRGASSVQFIGSKGWVGLWGYADSMGYIIHSEDGGNTWTNQTMNKTAVTIYNLHFVNVQKGVACGLWNWAYPYDNSCGIVFYTNDGGNSWNVGDAWNPGPIAMGFYNDIWMIGDTGYVAGAADPESPQVYYIGMIKKTVDGGQTWAIKKYSTPQQGEQYLGLHFVTPSIGWVGGNGGLIIHTQDGGNSWLYDNSNTSRAIWDIHGVTYQIGGNLKCYLWAVGSYGTILHLKVEFVDISEKNSKIILNKIPNLLHNSFIFIDKNFYLYDIQGKKLKGMNKSGIYFLKNKKGNKNFKIIKF